MKAVIKEKEKEKAGFPCLMRERGNETIVLFCKEMVGTVIGDGFIKYGLGHYSDNWDMSEFTPFNGTIELSN